MAYHPKSLQFLSLLQILVGSISLLLGIGNAVLQSDSTSFMIIGFGIWVGVWIIVTGMLGFFGSRDRQVPNRCLLGTFLGFAITACVFAGVMIISYSFALAVLVGTLNCYDDSSCYRLPNARAGIGVEAVLLFIGVVEFSVAMASSIFCCNAVCTGNYRVLQGEGIKVVYIQPTMGQLSTNAGGGAFFVTTAGAPGTVMQGPITGQFIAQQPAGQQAFEPVSRREAIPGSMVNQPRQTTAQSGMATGQTHQGYENFSAFDAKTNLIQE